MKDNISSELMSYIQNHRIINTHSHHREDPREDLREDHCFETVTLDNLLSDSYVNWSGVPLPATPGERVAYLMKVQSRSYFVWLQKALQDLYGFTEPISSGNWDSISRLMELSHQDRRFHLEVIQKKCGYQKVILDAYWQPGSDNGHAGLFTPALRVNSFFYGYSSDSKDHNGNNCRNLYGIAAQNIDNYVEAMKTVILQKRMRAALRSNVRWLMTATWIFKAQIKHRRIVPCRVQMLIARPKTSGYSRTICSRRSVKYPPKQTCLCSAIPDLGFFRDHVRSILPRQ